MVATATRSLGAAESAAILEKALPGFRGDLTVADASARGGLALRDAETALFHLAGECPAHLRATEHGDVVFSFSDGFVRTRADGAFLLAARAVGRALSGIGRFVVRAWVSVVMIGYAVVFLSLLIAWTLKSDDNDGVGDVLVLFLRVMAEALFWTFHPFSPVYLQPEHDWARRRSLRGRRQGTAPKVPLFERVNRFVFGPPPEPANPRQRERELLAEVRRLDGRVGAMDVVRVTGGARARAEALLCRMLVDYDGDVEATEQGAVVYKFPSLRKTASASADPVDPAPRPIWEGRPASMPPLTGNGAGSNLLFAAINGLNLAASGLVTAQGAEALGSQGLWWGLGVAPLAFSTTLFVLPLSRLLLRGRKRRQVARENGRRGLLQAVLGRTSDGPVVAAELAQAWEGAGGGAIDEAAVTREIRDLGGEPDVDDAGRLIFRFEEHENERRALAVERRAAPAAERALGRVVFASDDDKI